MAFHCVIHRGSLFQCSWSTFLPYDIAEPVDKDFTLQVTLFVYPCVI